MRRPPGGGGDSLQARWRGERSSGFEWEGPEPRPGRLPKPSPGSGPDPVGAVEAVCAGTQFQVQTLLWESGFPGFSSGAPRVPLPASPGPGVSGAGVFGRRRRLGNAGRSGPSLRVSACRVRGPRARAGAGPRSPRASHPTRQRCGCRPAGDWPEGLAAPHGAGSALSLASAPLYPAMAQGLLPFREHLLSTSWVLEKFGVRLRRKRGSSPRWGEGWGAGRLGGGQSQEDEQLRWVGPGASPAPPEGALEPLVPLCGWGN